MQEDMFQHSPPPKRGSPSKNPFLLEERKTIERMLKEGKSYEEIQRALPLRSAGGIRAEVYKHSTPQGYSADEAQKYYADRKYNRVLNPVHRANQETINDIKNMFSEGKKVVAISQHTGLSLYVLRKILRNEPNPTTIKNKETSNLEERICSLEMQVEIIIDQLRRKNDSTH